MNVACNKMTKNSFQSIQSADVTTPAQISLYLIYSTLNLFIFNCLNVFFQMHYLDLHQRAYKTAFVICN